MNENDIKDQHTDSTADIDQGVRVTTVTGVPENTFAEGYKKCNR